MLMRFQEVFSRRLRISPTTSFSSKGAWLEGDGLPNWIRDFTTSRPRLETLPMVL